MCGQVNYDILLFMKRLFYAIPVTIFSFLYTHTASAHNMVDMPVTAAPESHTTHFLMLGALFTVAILVYFWHSKTRLASASTQARSYRQFGQGLLAIFAALTLFIHVSHIGGAICMDDSGDKLGSHTQHECCVTPVAVLAPTVILQANQGLFAVVPYTPTYLLHPFSFSINNKSPPAHA